MDLVEKKVTQLIAKHGTTNPFRLCEMLGVKVFICNIPGKGVYHVHKSIPMIYISEHLSDSLMHFTCAHELGHHLLHRSMNRIFFDANTLFKQDKYEIEADYFATVLLKIHYKDL